LSVSKGQQQLSMQPGVLAALMIQTSPTVIFLFFSLGLKSALNCFLVDDILLARVEGDLLHVWVEELRATTSSPRFLHCEVYL